MYMPRVGGGGRRLGGLGCVGFEGDPSKMHGMHGPYLQQ